MTLLERLKDVAAGSAFHNAILEDLTYGEFDTLVDALPALIAVAEAAKWVRETTNHAYVLNQAAVKGALKRLDAALAKLEGEV